MWIVQITSKLTEIFIITYDCNLLDDTILVAITDVISRVALYQNSRA